jgi:hypothetical protein
MSVDVSKIQAGDEVAVKFLVVHINEHDVFLAKRAGGPAETDAEVSRIVSHTRKALIVGDRVRAGWVDEVVEILLIDGNRCACRSPTYGLVLRNLNELERAQ